MATAIDMRAMLRAERARAAAAAAATSSTTEEAAGALDLAAGAELLPVPGLADVW
jgi:hypothetical protein